MFLPGPAGGNLIWSSDFFLTIERIRDIVDDYGNEAAGKDDQSRDIVGEKVSTFSL